MKHNTDKPLDSNDELLPEFIVSRALESLGITLTHKPECIEEIAYYLQNNGQNNGLDDPALIDLTYLPFVTIDHDHSNDFFTDQALYVERDAEGYRVMYALADVAYYVQPGSALFSQALERGATYRTCVSDTPMLPVELLTALTSLSPDIPRRALVFEIHLDVNITVRSYNIRQARICCAATLSYGSVQRWLDTKAADTQKYHASLKLLKEVGTKLIETSTEPKTVYFDNTQAQFIVSGSPPRVVATSGKRFDTEHYCQHISQICDRQGAIILMGLAGVSDVLQAMFRVHDLPLKKSLNALKAALNEWASSDAQPEMWQWHDGQTLAQFVGALPKDKVHGRRVYAIQRQIMQAQKNIAFAPEPGDHHALRKSGYVRFSSPANDIVGLYAQAELLEALRGARYTHNTDDLLIENVIQAAKAVRQQQRALDKKIAFSVLHSYFMSDLENNDAQWRMGTIIGIGTDKLYVSLDDLAIDIKIYRTDLEAWYATQYTSTNTHTIACNQNAQSWQLGQCVNLKLQRYDVAKLRFIFCMQAHTQTQ